MISCTHTHIYTHNSYHPASQIYLFVCLSIYLLTYFSKFQTVSIRSDTSESSLAGASSHSQLQDLILLGPWKNLWAPLVKPTAPLFLLILLPGRTGSRESDESQVLRIEGGSALRLIHQLMGD